MLFLIMCREARREKRGLSYKKNRRLSWFRCGFWFFTEGARRENDGASVLKRVKEKGP